MLSSDSAKLRHRETLSAFQVRVFLLCAIVALLDGFDTQAIAFAAPVIAKGWQVDVTSFGGVFAAGLLGGLVGAVAIGRLADVAGRKPAMMGSLAIMGLGSLIAPFAGDRLVLTISRVIAGVGMGGALPCAIALTSEYAPPRLRASLTTAMFCAFPLGAIIGAIASGPVLQSGNWRALFWVGGLTPLAIVPLVWRWMPESIGWLGQRGRQADVERLVAASGASFLTESATASETPSTAATHGGLGAVVTDGRLRPTALLGTAFLVSLLLVYLLVNWVPALTVAAGGSPARGAQASALLNITGIIGGLVIAFVGDRSRASKAVSFAYIAAAAGCGLLSLAAMSVPAVLILCAVAGFLCVGAQMCLVSLAAARYPLHLRASAIGLLMAIGRIGAVSGPLVGSALIGGPQGYLHLVWSVGIGSLIAGIAIVALPEPRSASPGTIQ